MLPAQLQHSSSCNALSIKLPPLLACTVNDRALLVNLNALDVVGAAARGGAQPEAV